MFSLLLCIPALVWTVDLLADTPAMILAAATLPAMLLAAAIVFAQRGSPRPRLSLVLALAWGAIGAACLSSIGNDLARSWLDAFAGDSARTVTALLVAPALEESAKALGLVLFLLVRPAWLRNARDGIACGALIGVGFVWTENFLYLGVSMLQGGEEGLMRALYLRGILDGVAHAVFAATAGAAAGYAASMSFRDWTARVAPAAGLVLAALQHAAWNASAAPAIVATLCGAVAPGGVCTGQPTNAALFGGATLVAVLFLAPGIALAAFVWRSNFR